MSDLSTTLSIWLLAITAILFLSARAINACRKANLTQWGSETLNLIDGLNRIFCEKYHRMERTDIGLPKTGAAILVSNHISGLDPLLLIAASRRPLRFLIAKEEYERFGLNWLFKAVGCIPVDRTGRSDKALREAMSAIQRGEVIAIFPHGKIHLPSDSPRKLKKGAISLASREKINIYPIKIMGVSGVGEVVSAVFKRGDAKVILNECLDSSLLSVDELELELESLYF